MASNSAVVNLFQVRPSLTPAETLSKLSEDCEALNIDKHDVYGDFNGSSSSSSLRKFEEEVAHYLGKEDAVFLPSGVMAQMIVLAIARSAGRSSFACHHTSHLLLHEQNSFDELLKMHAVVVGGGEKEELVRDALRFDAAVAAVAAAPSPDDVGVLFLECPHREVGGRLTPLEEVARLSRWCAERGVHFHMDGARLWEALPTYTAASSSEGNAVHAFTGLFDSLYVSFYKGLGGLAGAMLLGSRDYVRTARLWLRRFGGNVFTQLPTQVAAWAGFRANRDAFTARRDRLREVVAAVVQATGRATDGTSPRRLAPAVSHPFHSIRSPCRRCPRSAGVVRPARAHCVARARVLASAGGADSGRRLVADGGRRPPRARRGGRCRLHREGCQRLGRALHQHRPRAARDDRWRATPRDVLGVQRGESSAAFAVAPAPADRPPTSLSLCRAR